MTSTHWMTGYAISRDKRSTSHLVQNYWVEDDASGARVRFETACGRLLIGTVVKGDLAPTCGHCGVRA